MKTVPQHDQPQKKDGFGDMYALLNTDDPVSVSEIYREADQELMHAKQWDYKNPELLVNKVKELMEQIDPRTLSEKESEVFYNTLWFWYHHAVSCAIWRYSDKESAKAFAKRALEYQSDDHPNKITRLFYLLLHDKVQDAKEWASQITTEPERSTAAHFLAEYEENHFDLET